MITVPFSVERRYRVCMMVSRPVLTADSAEVSSVAIVLTSSVLSSNCQMSLAFYMFLGIVCVLQ